MVLSVSKPQLGTGHQGQDFQWGCCLNLPNMRGTHWIWSIFLVNENNIEAVLELLPLQKASVANPPFIKQMAKLWNWSGLTWQTSWLRKSHLACCIRPAITLQTHSILLSKFIEIFRLHYSYSGDVIQSGVFRTCIFKKSLRLFIIQLIHLQLCELKATLWESFLLNPCVKWLHSEIREELLFHLPCTALQNLTKGHCDFLFQFETSPLTFLLCHIRIQSELEAECLSDSWSDTIW